jgi:hypothetical protein
MKLLLAIFLAVTGCCTIAQCQTAQSSPGGSTVTKSRAPSARRYASLDSLPDWSGIWTPNFNILVNTGEQPLLTPVAAAAYKARQEADARNEEPATDSANCVPPGMPTVMFQPYDIEFLFTPGRVTIIQEAYMQVRRVFTDGRDHPAKVDPTFNGHSIGHWEGDTLVIDTVGLGHDRPLGFGFLNHGPQLHVIERIRLTAPEALEDQMTLTDPDMLTKPWHPVYTFARHREWDQLEFICEENNRNQIDNTGKVSSGVLKQK